jgi:hypothetical protein
MRRRHIASTPNMTVWLHNGSAGRPPSTLTVATSVTSTVSPADVRVGDVSSGPVPHTYELTATRTFVRVTAESGVREVLRESEAGGWIR